MSPTLNKLDIPHTSLTIQTSHYCERNHSSGSVGLLDFAQSMVHSSHYFTFGYTHLKGRYKPRTGHTGWIVNHARKDISFVPYIVNTNSARQVVTERKSSHALRTVQTVHGTVQFYVYLDYSNTCTVLPHAQFLCAVLHTAVHRYWTCLEWRRQLRTFLLQVYSSPCGAVQFRTVPLYFPWMWTFVHTCMHSSETHVYARLCSMVRCREVSCGYMHHSHAYCAL